MPMTLDNAEPIIGHGKCSYMKEERVAKLVRESGGRKGYIEHVRTCYSYLLKNSCFSRSMVEGMI